MPVLQSISRSRTVTALIAVLTGVSAIMFVSTLVRATVYAPEDGGDVIPPELPGPPIVAQTESLPARLQIPALAIDAHVQQVGMNAKGDMKVPSNFKDVGWYRYGTIPGQLGSAVIDGHVDNGLSLGGVFRRLGDIKVGDDVYVVTQDGTRLHFVVRGIETYPYSDAPTERIFGADDAARLNLITCAGTWIRGKQTYADRLVVYTTFVNA